jgi:hypothetical protein
MHATRNAVMFAAMELPAAAADVPAVTVSVRVGPAPDPAPAAAATILVEVTDSGPGLGEHAASAIAAAALGGGVRDAAAARSVPYRRRPLAASPPPRHEGKGLAICARLASLMGGGVALRDRADGRGAVFTLTLPLLAASALVDAPTPTRPVALDAAAVSDAPPGAGDAALAGPARRGYAPPRSPDRGPGVPQRRGGGRQQLPRVTPAGAAAADEPPRGGGGGGGGGGGPGRARPHDAAGPPRPLRVLAVGLHRLSVMRRLGSHIAWRVCVARDDAPAVVAAAAAAGAPFDACLMEAGSDAAVAALRAAGHTMPVLVAPFLAEDARAVLAAARAHGAGVQQQ